MQINKRLMTTEGVFAILDCLLLFRMVSSERNIDKSNFEVQLMQEGPVAKQARKYDRIWRKSL